MGGTLSCSKTAVLPVNTNAVFVGCEEHPMIINQLSKKEREESGIINCEC